ncbi:hypothetical protein ACLOJK_023778 [Asimina triloba]
MTFSSRAHLVVDFSNAVCLTVVAGRCLDRMIQATHLICDASPCRPPLTSPVVLHLHRSSASERHRLHHSPATPAAATAIIASIRSTASPPPINDHDQHGPLNSKQAFILCKKVKRQATVTRGGGSSSLRKTMEEVGFPVCYKSRGDQPLML